MKREPVLLSCCRPWHYIEFTFPCILLYCIFHVLLVRSCVLPIVFDSLLDWREVQGTARCVSEPQVWAAFLQILPGELRSSKHLRCTVLLAVIFARTATCYGFSLRPHFEEQVHYRWSAPSYLRICWMSYIRILLSYILSTLLVSEEGSVAYRVWLRHIPNERCWERQTQLPLRGSHFEEMPLVLRSLHPLSRSLLPPHQPRRVKGTALHPSSLTHVFILLLLCDQWPVKCF